MSLAHSGPVLVSGAAGFIGYQLCDRLLNEGCEVVGLDNMNAYYDPRLKEARLARLEGRPGFAFKKLNLADREGMAGLFAAVKPTVVVNLAAQAGVRYSIENPHAYVDSNVVGFINVLEGCRHHGVKHLVYASSSSVYGLNTKMPFSVRDNVDHPVSLYAATKKANELMAHSYSHLYDLPTTGLRFFTVYGPWGRPDMALFIFTRKILAGEPIEVYNHGKMQRDLTYIDDIIEGVRRVMDRLPEPDTAWSGDRPDPRRSSAPYRLYNIGNNNPVEPMDMIAALEASLGTKAEKRLLPIQQGDVPATYADAEQLETTFGFRPATPIAEGIAQFVEWFHNWRQAGRHDSFGLACMSNNSA